MQRTHSGCNLISLSFLQYSCVFSSCCVSFVDTVVALYRCPLLCIISCTFGEIMYHSTRLVIFTYDYTVLTLSYFPYFCLRLLSSNYEGLCFFHSHNSFDFEFLSGWQISQVWSFFVFQLRMFSSITARMLKVRLNLELVLQLMITLIINN